MGKETRMVKSAGLLQKANRLAFSIQLEKMAMKQNPTTFLKMYPFQTETLMDQEAQETISKFGKALCRLEDNFSHNKQFPIYKLNGNRLFKSFRTFLLDYN